MRDKLGKQISGVDRVICKFFMPFTTDNHIIFCSRNPVTGKIGKYLFFQAHQE